MFYDHFIELCQNAGVTPTKVARDIGIRQSTVSMWKKQGTTPKYETLKKLSDYFDVSVNYLLAASAQDKSPANDKKVQRKKNIEDIVHSFSETIEKQRVFYEETQFKKEGTEETTKKLIYNLNLVPRQYSDDKRDGMVTLQEIFSNSKLFRVPEDVLLDREDTEAQIFDILSYMPEAGMSQVRTKLGYMLNIMNYEGIAKVLAYACDLLGNKKYQRILDGHEKLLAPNTNSSDNDSIADPTPSEDD